MTKENWITIKQILDEVLRLAPAERERFFFEKDLPDEIRREVESLLAGEEESENFMSVAAGVFSKELFLESPLAGQRIGIYEIVRELGCGGMGAVYLSRRRDGKFEQNVALKMLKREFNVEKLRRNFAREKEILAKLENPFIARLLDAGTTADGVPFLVMEYVEGVPIDKFCEAANLPLKERLKLFNKVCEAVSFAHQNLVIHRDLKPSNIIVTPKGEPKLLDFGISKLLDAHEADDKTSITLLGAMTPEYASPEQIRGDAVSTATDIYSLGVVLYKMLTGAMPYKSSGKTNGEVLRAITEDEPTTPSAAKSEPSAAVGGLIRQSANLSVIKTDAKTPKDSNANFQQPAAADGSDLSKLKGDLDNIILKALSKEPTQRYSTVEQFAADIWRHLDGLPVYARRATVFYRAGKFFRRNKISVIAAALIFLSLVAGIAASVRQTRLAREAQRLSVIETEKARAEQAKSEKITKFMSKIIGYANPHWYAEGAKLKGQARVIDALEDLEGKIETEFADEADVAAELHHKFAEVFGWVSKNESGERREYFQQKSRFHTLRALELRVRFYGEWHELVAKDLFYSYTIIGKNDEEKAALLMRAILMMRDTNPNNLNLPYMLEAYTAFLILPQYEKMREPFRKAVLPATDENNYKIAEQMLRESLPVFRRHYKEDNSAIFSAECKLAYTLAMQEDRKDFDEHYAVCRQYSEKALIENAAEYEKYYVELIEKALAEKKL